MRIDPQFAGLDERITGDASVWRKLSQYVQRNIDAFGGG